IKPTIVTNHEIGVWLGSKGIDGEKIVAGNQGGTIEAEGVKVTLVHAEHSCGITEDDGHLVYGGEACGFVIEFENGFTIYFAGDTDVFGDMALIAELSKFDVAFLPIGDFYTMGPERAAKAVQLLGVNAVVFATAESAIKEARAADRHNTRKSVLGPLHGVPFTAKDIFNTAGLPTTAGLRMLRTNIPTRDATVIARMRRAGAILIGKTN